MGESQVVLLQAQLSAAIANEMRVNNELIDVVVNCNGQTFSAHRAILSAGSSYFRALFLSGVEDAAFRRVDLKGVDPEAFTTILDVLYCSEFQTPTSNQSLQKLIQAAYMLQVQPLYEHCCQEYLRKLSADYFADIWKTAETFQHAEMLQRIPESLANSFSRVQRSSDFGALNANQMRQLVSRANTQGVAADALVQGVLSWIKLDVASRREHLAPLFTNIDLSLLSPPFLSRLFMSEDLVKTSLEIMSTLMAIATSRMALGYTQPPKETSCDIKLLFIGHAGEATAMQYFDLQCKEWSVVMSMSFHLYDIGHRAAAYLQGQLYLMGGKTTRTNEASGNVFTYKPFTSGLKKLQSSLIDPAYNAWASVLDGKIYCVGGWGSDGSIQRSVQCYEPVGGSWSLAAPTQHGFCNPNVVTLGDHLYVIDSKELIVEKYDPTTNQWTDVDPPNINRATQTLEYCHAPAAACQGELFVYNRAKQLWSYDPMDNTWKKRRCDIQGVIKGLWSLSSRQKQLPYLLALDAEGVIHQYNPNDETCQQLSGSQQLPAGSDWIHVTMI